LGAALPADRRGARKLRQSHFIIDGEAIVLGADGVSDFAALHKHSEQAQLYAFDMLAGDGEDHRDALVAQGQPRPASLKSKPVDGIFKAHFEHGEIGPDLFRAACRMGLEGIVSKHRGRACYGGKCKHWVKVKNRAHPAYSPTAG